MPLPPSKIGCPMDAVLRQLMGPWTTYILWVLRSNGPTRFGELKRKVAGISAKVLTERLRSLEAAEIIERHYEPTVPPRVTYKMAERGNQLAPVLDQLSGLGQRWLDEDAARRSQREPAVASATREAATKSDIAAA